MGINGAMKVFPFKSTQINLIWGQARPAAVDPSIRVDFTTKKKGNLELKAKVQSRKFGDNHSTDAITTA